MYELSKRTSNFSDSVIRRMTRIANKYDAINLSQGFPDFAPPKEITDRLAEVAKMGPHQYAITWGAQNFREALARKHEHFSGMKIDPDSEIVVTCGSTEAMMASMMSIINPRDKVAIFSPFYENYGADTILSGAEPIYIPLVPPDFNFDVNLLEEAFRSGAKALILCNPSNPCGKKYLHVKNLKILLNLQLNMMHMLLLMKYMNILFMNLINMYIWLHCQVCVNEQSYVIHFPKRILLQVGDWDMS